MNPYYQDDYVTIYHGDCQEIAPGLGQFDLLLADPPYGIAYNREEVPQGKHIWSHGRQVDAVLGDMENFDPTPWLKYKRVVLWGANCYADRLPPLPTWLVWDKVTRNGLKLRIAECELAWTNCVGRPQVFRYLWSGGYRQGEQGEHYHPTQKPVALMSWCIQLAGDVQTVLDPFAGSGTTGRAAKDLGRKAVLIEREEKYCEIAARRMGQEVLPLEGELTGRTPT